MMVSMTLFLKGLVWMK